MTRAERRRKASGIRHQALASRPNTQHDAVGALLAAPRLPDRALPAASFPTPETIEFHIEEITLIGFAPGERRRIGDAVQGELTRLLAGPNLSAGGITEAATIERMDGGSFAMPGNRNAGSIGAQVAQAVVTAATVGAKR